jgi:hypothetical protein
MKVGDLYAYKITPMDFGWEFIPTVEEYADRLLAVEDDGPGAVRTFRLFVDRALEAAEAVGWEGDFREGPKVSVLPAAFEVGIALVWKQDNNGETFVVSPLELQYLEEEE